MRHFPRTARRRLAAAVAAIAVAVGAVAVPLANAEDLKHRQRHVQQRIRSAGADLEDSSGRLQRATAALNAAQGRLDAARRELGLVRSRLDAARVRDDEMQARLAAAEERLRTAEQDLARGRADLGAQREQVTGVITSIYEEGDPQLLAFSSLLDARSPADLTRRWEMQRAIVDRESRAYDDLRAAEVLLEVREEQVRDAKDEVEVQRQAAARHLVTMKDLTEQTKRAKARVQEMFVGRREAKWDAARARRHDRAVLHKLKQREQRIKKLIWRKARQARRSSHHGFTGSPGGLLDRPVPGIVTSPFGYRMHPIYHYWGLHNGTDFRAPCGTAMRAVAGGRVIARYYSSVYGNRLFLGLGLVNGRYLTAVYNHATGYRYSVGATVPRGAIVGYSGTTGWSTACHLHFEILENGRPVDPMRFL